MISPAAFEELAAAVAAELAPRIAAELRQSRGDGPSAAEEWRLLDLKQAADRLGRSTRWVRERAKRGDLPYVKLDGGALAFLVDDLEAFARARRVPADSAESLAARLQVLRDPASRAGLRRGHPVRDRVVSG